MDSTTENASARRMENAEECMERAQCWLREALSELDKAGDMEVAATRAISNVAMAVKNLSDVLFWSRIESGACSGRAVRLCLGATDGAAPSPGCGHAEHAPYRCKHRDDDGVLCDCAGSATDDDPEGES